MLIFAFVYVLITGVISQSSVLTFTRVPNPVTDGEPQAITYASNDTNTPVSIILKKGSASDLVVIDVLTKDASGGQFIWTPPLSLACGADYALEIKQNAQVNYFGPLTVQGCVAQSVSRDVSGSASTKSTASAASNPNKTSTKSRFTRASTTTKTSASTTSASSSSALHPSPTQISQAETGSKNSLSTGSAIGIGIGIAGAVAIATAVAFVIYKRRSKSRRSGNNDGPPATNTSIARLEEQSSKANSGVRHEKDGKAMVSELSTKANTHELSGTSRRFELPGN